MAYLDTRGITYPIFAARFAIKFFIPPRHLRGRRPEENRIVAALSNRPNRRRRFQFPQHARTNRGRRKGNGRGREGGGLHRLEKGPKAIRHRMSAWGDIQSFGGKRLQDGGSGPIGSNRGCARIRGGGRVASQQFMDSLGRSPAKLSCLSGSGLRGPGGLS